MTTSEVTLLFEYVNRVDELKRIIAQQAERIGNLEDIAQALADELIDAYNALTLASARADRAESYMAHHTRRFSDD